MDQNEFEVRDALDAARMVLRRRRGDQVSLAKLISGGTLALTLTFAAGRNWERIDDLFRWRDVHAEAHRVERKELEATLEATYVRKDVIEEQLRVLNDQIEELRRQIGRLDATLNRRER